MFCESCGKQVWEEDSICPHCNSPVNPRGADRPAGLPAWEDHEMSAGGGAGGATITALQGILGKWGGGDMETTMGSVALAADEFIVRKYLCAQVMWPKCFGYLFVTNRRLLFHAFRNGIFANSRTVLETPLDSVSGITTYYGGRFSAIRFLIWQIPIAAVVVGLMATVWIGGNSSKSDPGCLGVGIFIICFILSIVGLAAAIWLSIGKTFFIKIFSSKAKGSSPIDMGHAPSRGFFEALFGRLFEDLYGGLFGSLFGGREQFNLKLRPTKQTDNMMLELGALIRDLQTMGDGVAERWKQ